MNSLTLGIFLSLLVIINCYNPVPMGAVVITTVSQIYVMQPVEYGGTDALNPIFTAMNITIVSSIFDPTARNLYVMYMNTTNGSLYLSQLVSTETLSSTVYLLPITFSTANINQMTSFSSDVDNRRAFYTSQTGAVSLFSMSGLLSTTIAAPLNLTGQIRSVAYTSSYNRLFVITDTTVDSCTNLDTNNLQCCQPLARGTQFCALTFDTVNGDVYAYALDRTAGIYRIVLDSTGCPTNVQLINKLGPNTNLQFAIDRGLYVASGSALGGQDNSYLYIVNGTTNFRTISVGHQIVALHISIPNTQTTSTEETCFHGVTYTLYRTAVVLAALFGTIMGIFMCFNALFCIDFFMTKRIIRSLKEQIPHNLLEDRWNKLVEEKYAKLALEKQRKKDDPPPPPRRQSSVSGRKNSSAVIPVNSDDNPNIQRTTTEAPQYLSARPSIAEYIRRKSEGYLNRRRSDDTRSSRHTQLPEELAEIRSYPARTQMTTAQVHIEPLHEEQERKGLRQTLSRKELLKDEDFL